MIVVAGSDSLLLVTQNDHAALAAELLSLWRRDGLPDSPRRESLLSATREHDNGWRETDSAPLVDAGTGHPHDFTSLPAAARRELWERGTSRYLEGDPWSALLITEHGLRLHDSLRDRPGWGGFFESLEERRAELLERSAADLGALDADYRLLALADSLALALCCRSSEPFEGHGYHVRPATDVDDKGGLESCPTLHLDPFPFAGATTFQLPYRRIPDRTYGGDADLGVELATARWRRLAVRVAPD